MSQVTSKTRRLFKTEMNLDHKMLVRFNDRIENPSKPLKVVIFGKYNHGKSTFLNAWLKQDLSKTGDTRVTTQVQSYVDRENDIIWVDTPGLDADKEDDNQASNMVKEADLVLLVHDAVAGELDKNEQDFIQQYSASIGKGKIRLLLTKIDQNEANMSQIMDLIEAQIQPLNITIFPLSAIRYQKYMANGGAIWKEKSGFDALDADIQKVSLSRNTIRKEAVNLLCNELVQQLLAEKKRYQNKIDQLAREKRTKQRELNRAAKNIFKVI